MEGLLVEYNLGSGKEYGIVKAAGDRLAVLKENGKVDFVPTDFITGQRELTDKGIFWEWATKHYEYEPRTDEWIDSQGKRYTDDGLYHIFLFDELF